MIKSALGVILPSVINFIFVILFVRYFDSSIYDNYVYLLSLISIPNAILFQPFVARIKTKLFFQEEIVISLYKWYSLIAVLIFFSILHFYTTLESIFLVSYALLFSILGLEKTVSNIKDKSNWIVFQLIMPTVLLLCLLVCQITEVDYSFFLNGIIMLFTLILLVLFFLRIKNLKVLKKPHINSTLIGAFDKRLIFLIVAGISIFASTNFFKILIYNQIENEGLLFNYDILQKICVLYSTFFLVQYSRYVFRFHIQPKKMLLPYFLGGTLLLLLFVFGFDYLLKIIFDVPEISITILELILIVVNLILVGILPILDTYFNSQESYIRILILYIIYIGCLCLFYFLLSFLGIQIMFSYQLASIFSVSIVIITLKYDIGLRGN